MNKDGWGGRSVDGPASWNEEVEWKYVVKVEGCKSLFYSVKLGLPFCFLPFLLPPSMKR